MTFFETPRASYSTSLISDISKGVNFSNVSTGLSGLMVTSAAARAARENVFHAHYADGQIQGLAHKVA